MFQLLQAFVTSQREISSNYLAWLHDYIKILRAWKILILLDFENWEGELPLKVHVEPQ